MKDAKDMTDLRSDRADGFADKGRDGVLSGLKALTSSELFGTRNEVLIAHGDALYRLRITSQGKLILTK